MSALPDRAAVVSLSNRHNSDEKLNCSNPDLPFFLTGSQAKTAHALRLNAEKLIRSEGLERIGFLTLTVGDEGPEGFTQVFDAAEASRRINNLNRRVLPALFSRAIVVTERHKNGAIHFHVIGAMASGADIRSGFDFGAFMDAREARAAGRVDVDAERAYKASVAPALRSAWAYLREHLPSYGFGRAELTPIRKSGEAIASYVAKYVQKNLFNRTAEDRRKKLVRYVGWNRTHTRANDFGWASPRAAAWRVNARNLAHLAGAEHHTVSQAFGPRWAYTLTRVMNAVRGDRENVIEFRSWPERECARRIVVNECGPWSARHERLRA